MRWPRRITRGKFVQALRRQQGIELLSRAGPASSSLAHQHGEGAIGLQHDAGAVERDDAGLGMVSRIVSSSRRRSSMAWLAAVSCAEEVSASLRLASRSAAM